MTDLLVPTDVGVEPARPSDGDTAPRPARPSRAHWFGVGWLAFVTFHAVFASVLPWMRGESQLVRGAGPYRKSPGFDFWFGSDRLGQDVFARCIYGARLALTVATASIVIGLLVGGALGLVAGYYRGWIDRAISVVTDALLAFPAIVFAALVVGRFDALQSSDIEVFGFGFEWLSRRYAIVFIFSLLSIAPIARIVRAQTLSLAEREYVVAARSIGAGTPRILFREILPNLVPAMMSVAFTGIAILLAAEGGLAFLGYSVKIPAASWGLMISEARADIDIAWWATLFPAVMLFATVLSFNLIGDRLATRFDVREAAL